MSNVPPNPYNNASLPSQMNAYPGQQMLNHPQPPINQPYSGLKQDSNSSSPLHGPSISQNSAFMGSLPNLNNVSSNSSPAFNRPGGMMPPPSGIPSSMLPPIKPLPVSAPSPQTLPFQSNPRSLSNTNTPSPYPPNIPQQDRQINDIAPPLIPSSQGYNHNLTNGPPTSGPPLVPLVSASSQPHAQYPVASRAFSPPGIGLPVNTNITPLGMANQGPQGLPSAQKAIGPIPSSQNNPTFPGQYASSRSTSSVPGPQVNMPITSGHMMNTLRHPGVNGSVNNNAPIIPVSMSQSGPLGPRMPQLPGPPASLPPGMPPMSIAPSGPPSSMSLMGPPRNGPTQPGLPLGPSGAMPPVQNHLNQPGLQPMSKQILPPTGLQSGPTMPGPNVPFSAGPQAMSPQSGHMGLRSGPPTGLQGGPSMQPQNMQPGLQSGPQSLPNMPRPNPSNVGVPPPGMPKSNMQNRYPQMQQSNFNQIPPQSIQYPQQHANALAQQMGQLSVTKQGFDQLWGHQNIDLLQCRQILPEYPEDPPEIRLGNQFADAPNCSPDIFRCTVNRIPETNSLLQKSRLPLGILIHPFKDLNHLPVIQCATIVRCRACRTYINPFVYFVDSKRWKCNLCFRVNDLPEEFQYDPVSKSYGDPSRRPEIKSATIEFIAPSEYMLRPPQPAVYLFLLDVSQLARESNYIDIFCKTLKNSLDQLPGDARTQVGFICYDAHIHYYLMSEGLTRPKEMTVLDIDDVFLPSPESLLVNLGERRELITELLSVLPKRFSGPGVPGSALGAALQAAYKLMAPTGGRITVFQTCLPNVGPGALTAREDPNARSAKDVAHLNPATDFYKRLALDCSGAQVAVDLFLLNSQYADLATLSGMSKFSAGSVYHIPLFSAQRGWQAEQLRRMLNRYITRKIGFEAVMRVRVTRGITIHTFHGNFFVRSTDLLSLPNVSPDAGFGMQLTIEESLSDLQQVCFQAALLYTSSRGERRIRVHTLALPIATTLPEVLHSADQMCIIGLLSKMAVDRCAAASLAEAREALMTVCVDVAGAQRLAQNLPAGASLQGLFAPSSLRLLPLYLLALLKKKAFRTGTSTRLDDRVADMCALKCLPLAQLLRSVYPDLYALHVLRAPPEPAEAPDPPRLHLSAERVNSNGAYLLDDGETMLIYVCHAVSPAYLSEVFGVASFSQLPDEARTLPHVDSEANQLLHIFIDKLNDDRPYPSNILILRDNSPSRLLFTERLVDDRVESAFSYYEFLQHIKSQVK